MADPSSELRVLLVDDDAVDAEGVVRAFKKTNITHPVVRAMDGVEALQILRGDGESPKLTKPYLVLLDLNMPRMSGAEFLREVRKDPDLKDTIVFVLTTSQADADKIAVYDLNVAGYLVKDEVGRDYQALTGLLRHYWEVVEFPPANEA